MRRNLSRWASTAAALVVAAALTAACGSNGSPTIASQYDITNEKEVTQAASGQVNRLVVGGKNFFVEQDILGHITLIALRAAGGNPVNKLDLGGTQEVRSALLGGRIDMYWGYTGTAAIIHLGLADLPNDPQKVYQLVKKKDRKRNGIAWLEPAPANNTYAIAIREEVYDQQSPAYDEALASVKTLSDLGRLIAQHPEKATLCTGPEFKRRADGLAGMENFYGFEFPEGNVKVVPALAVYEQVDTGQRCNFGVVFKTSGYIPELGLRLLKDDKGFFPPYNPSLSMRVGTLKRFPDLEPLFEDIASRLTTQTLRKLNGKVLIGHVSPEQVARNWLQQEGLIE